MGNALERKKPEKHLSEEMIDRGHTIGKVAMVLTMLNKDVSSKKSPDESQPSGSTGNALFTSRAATDHRRQSDSSGWAKFVTKGPSKGASEGKTLLNPTQLKKQREKDRSNLRSEEPYYSYTEDVISYDALLEEDMDKRQCNYCSVITRDDIFECRICGKDFHRTCLLRRGIGQDMNSERALKDAEKAGWSCLECEDLSYVLPMDVMSDLMADFDAYDRTGSSSMTFGDYVRSARLRERRDGTPCNELELRKKFVEYDRDHDGTVTWHDFAMVEAVNYLKKLPNHEILRYLKPLEVGGLRRLFRELDTANTGVLTMPDSEKAYRKWLTSLDIPVHDEVMKSEQRASGPNHNRLITWERFIRNKALSIITSRPNTRTIRPYLTSMEHHWMD